MADDLEITSEDVTRDIDYLSNVSEKTIEEKLKFARVRVAKDGIEDDVKRAAILAYTRHLLVMTAFVSTGGVTRSDTLGQEFENVDLTKSNPFLDEYKEILNDFGNGGWTAKFL